MSSMETISVIYCFPHLAEVGGVLVDIILFLEILFRKLLLVFKLTTVLLLKTSVSLKETLYVFSTLHNALHLAGIQRVRIIKG